MFEGKCRLVDLVLLVLTVCGLPLFVPFLFSPSGGDQLSEYALFVQYFYASMTAQSWYFGVIQPSFEVRNESEAKSE